MVKFVIFLAWGGESWNWNDVLEVLGKIRWSFGRRGLLATRDLGNLDFSGLVLGFALFGGRFLIAGVGE